MGGFLMMGRKEETQGKLEFIDLNSFVPSDHVLRIIQEKIDFSFIYKKMEKYYSKVGRKSLDPVLLFKMILIGYLFNIDSERQLEKEVILNLAYRWFLGLDLTDPVPDHSVFSQNRRRRFKDGKVFQEIFDHIIQLCVDKGIVTGEVIVTDSTHIKASAAKDKVQKVEVTQTPSQYLNTLEEEAKKIEMELEEKRKEAGTQKRGRKPKGPITITTSVVTTDPDSGLLNRPGKPGGPHYLAHTSIDAANGIIVDIHPTAGNLNDCELFVERLNVTQEKFGLDIKKAGADRGYDTTPIYHGLNSLGIIGYISPTESNSASDSTSYREFTYIGERDAYICLNQKVLSFTHLAQSKKGQYIKTYSAKARDCKVCPLRDSCFGPTASKRTIGRPIAHELLEANAERAKTNEYKWVQKLRRVWCEGSFGTMKMKHNLYKTYKRGIEKILEQCLFSALALNLKRMIKVLD
ncbi:IS1182 family transposase [Metabacillus sediminilitoris]|uniref:IS1182 family transposase n=2 Tax=Metabacillus sediminilitoris TaxID=2567941 RepID=A0A4S4BIG5_9BACI|nr:IS1182 family transposase [Metabacillus sediminilitoris]THF74278.1 IS1182 family transposase [Metabacillus sediminilitoris]